jgi:hypothetical protein
VSGNGPKSPAGGVPQEVLFEFRRVGNSVRVVAVDPVTNTEITIVGAPGTDDATLKRLAARKLAYVIAKKRSS